MSAVFLGQQEIGMPTALPQRPPERAYLHCKLPSITLQAANFKWVKFAAKKLFNKNFEQLFCIINLITT